MNVPMKFRKRPVVIRAIQFTGTNHQKVLEFIHEDRTTRGITGWLKDGAIRIKTLEGTMIASVGDWIIKGVQGEFYPCKPDIFFETYVLVPGDE